MIQSNGGAISVDEIGHAPASLVLSGPAAGVGSLKFFGNDTGSEHLISIEVGGTSCDVTLMQRGAISMADQLVVDGYHLAIPAVDIHTVGRGRGHDRLGWIRRACLKAARRGGLHAGPAAMAVGVRIRP